jgi:hypothetical protein
MAIKVLIRPSAQQYMFFLFEERKELDTDECVSYILLVKL